MKYIHGDGSITYDGNIEENKEQAMRLIHEDFISLGRTNKFMTSFGWEADNRWIEINDIDNATCAIDVWFEDNEHAFFRDTSNISHSLTIDQLKQLKKEAQKNRLQVFSLKWIRESLVHQTESIEEVWTIFEFSIPELITDYTIKKQAGLVL